MLGWGLPSVFWRGVASWHCRGFLKPAVFLIFGRWWSRSHVFISYWCFLKCQSSHFVTSCLENWLLGNFWKHFLTACPPVTIWLLDFSPEWKLYILSSYQPSKSPEWKSILLLLLEYVNEYEEMLWEHCPNLAGLKPDWFIWWMNQLSRYKPFSPLSKAVPFSSPLQAHGVQGHVNPSLINVSDLYLQLRGVGCAEHKERPSSL